MYILELFLKKFRERKNKKVVIPTQDDNFSEYENCDHTFMPIDSTGKIFACSKCGQILKK